MPKKNNKKRQTKLPAIPEHDNSQPSDNGAQYDPSHDAPTIAQDLNNIAATEDDPVCKVDKGKDTAQVCRTPKSAIEEDVVAGFASSFASASTAPIGPASTMNSITAQTNPQTPQQVKEDRIASLRLATEQTNAETERLQEVLEDKRTELQTLKDRLRELTGGNKNEYSRQVKIVMREVEAKRKEIRGVK